MPIYGMPGVSMGRNGSRAVGAFVVVVAVVAVVGARVHTGGPGDTHLHVQLRTEQIGEGIVTGTKVRMDGVTIGQITDIQPVAQGRQLITLDLDRRETGSLTDAFTVDYAPENLFGISALTLRRAEGGAALRDNSVIDLAGRVNDVTMGNLLRTLAGTTTDVLTTKLTDLITRFNSDLQAFTPLLQAIVMLSRNIADTQRFPSPYLLDQYSSFFGGLGDFASATFKLFNSVLNIEILKDDRPRYDATINMVVDGGFPAFGHVGDVAHTHLQGYAELFTPLIGAIAATVPTPGRSRTDVQELIDRLDRMFTNGPDGPALNVTVALRAIPGLGVPLLGQSGFDALGGGR
ncbi:MULTISPECIES: MlaD family protein [unclassified Nocardia]|uniref:MlaD family protein n=1 Tax=unclassified Nocardia TaxID=2637762 RepID=UPI001CE42509|nr:MULTISPECIES: MlaD family protein [unclassified Nocardia]